MRTGHDDEEEEARTAVAGTTTVSNRYKKLSQDVKMWLSARREDYRVKALAASGEGVGLGLGLG